MVESESAESKPPNQRGRRWLIFLAGVLVGLALATGAFVIFISWLIDALRGTSL